MHCYFSFLRISLRNFIFGLHSPENNEIELRLKSLANYDIQTVFAEIQEHLEGYLKKNHIVTYHIYLSDKAPGFDKSGKFKEIFQDTV